MLHKIKKDATPPRITCINACCKWTGEFSALGAHLTADCKFEETPCKYCGALIYVGVLAHHFENCASKPPNLIKQCKDLKRVNETLSAENVWLQFHKASLIDMYRGIKKVEDPIYLARVCESMENYAEMREYMPLVCAEKFAKKEELSVNERALFSVSYQNLIGELRASLRSICEEHEEGAYKNVIMQRGKSLINEGLDIMNDLLLYSKHTQNILFYRKTQGDYLRYLAEFVEGHDKEMAKMKSKNAYHEQAKLSSTCLSPTDPIRLGLALSTAVFTYEILGDKQTAIQIAKDAFNKALAKIDEIEEDKYRDVTLILQLLRDNLCLRESDK